MKAVIAFAGLALIAATTTPALAVIPISKAEAGKIADATVKSWTSMDAAKIKGLYAPTIIGFDPAIAPLATSRASWDKLQEAYAAAKIDKSTQKERVIQILDADTFVVSGAWDVWSTTIPANKWALRCTDVYEKVVAGKWSIVTEHCSQAPTG